MAHGKDYVPRKDGDFDHFFKHICDYSAQKVFCNPSVWYHIPPAAMTALQAAWAEWNAAYLKDLEGRYHFTDDTREKNRVRRDKEPVLREFVQRYLKYDPVTDYDRDQMGIPNADPTKTPIRNPSEHVLLLVEPTHTREHTIIWEVEETHRRAKPYGYDGVVLVKEILEPGAPVPTDAKAMGNSRLLTKNHVVEEFSAADQGKRCAYAACWQNESGGTGPWSDIVVVVIA